MAEYPIVDDDEPVIDRIVDHKMKYGKEHFRIRYKGKSHFDDIWIAGDKFAHQDLISRYKANNRQVSSIWTTTAHLTFDADCFSQS